VGLDTIDADFVVNTPMFMGGADNSQAELRLPSILGALRFWYRATAPGELVSHIDELRKAEAKLFGSSEEGQGAFLSCPRLNRT
jgi:CRISPR-associated protein Cmr1